MCLIKKRKCHFPILNIIGVICLYILATTVFPIIRVPFSIFDTKTTNSFNSLVESLAIGYLTGVFLYYLTIIKKYKKERSLRLFEIYDAVKKLSDVVADIEAEFGNSIDVIIVKDYKDYYSESVHQKFGEMITQSLEKLLLYRDILKQDELDIIFEIRKIYPVIEAYDDNMDSKQITMMCNTLVNVCKLIYTLQNSIIVEVHKKSQCGC